MLCANRLGWRSLLEAIRSHEEDERTGTGIDEASLWDFPCWWHEAPLAPEEERDAKEATKPWKWHLSVSPWTYWVTDSNSARKLPFHEWICWIHYTTSFCIFLIENIITIIFITNMIKIHKINIHRIKWLFFYVATII